MATPLYAPRRVCLLFMGALGLVLAAPPVWAQAASAATTGSEGKQPSDSGAVIVNAPRHRPRHSFGVPPERADAFAAEAAKDEAWGAYRDSIPPLTAGTLEGSKDYPGLHTLVPQ